MASNFAERRVLLTGATGFIGSHLARKLVRSGLEVCVLIDADSDLARLDDIKQQISIYKATCWKKPELQKILLDANPDTIFHLRAKINSNPGFGNKDSFLQTNFEDTRQLAEAAYSSNLELFVQLGTIAEYGSSPSPFKENGPAEPVSDYGKSKLAATKWLKAFWHSHKFPAVILRLSLAYGPGQNPHSFLIPNVIISCLKKQDFYIASSGLQTRDPLFIDDIIAGCVSIISSAGAKGEIINLGLGQEFAVVEIANMINNILGKPINIITGSQPMRFGENEHYWNDITKARHILGWKPEVSLEEGLKRSIAWYQTHAYEKE